MALANSLSPSPLIEISAPNWQQHGVRLSIKRDECLHPVLSGNKWRKLKYVLNHVVSSGYHGIVSMGGAYSNHLHALAFACQALNIPVIGLIRGEANQTLTPTLKDVSTWGMQLEYVSRQDYRQLRYSTPDSNRWLKRYPDYFWLPEGGALNLALQGVAEILDELPDNYDWLSLACGTGTTLAGLASRQKPPHKLLGVAAVKHGDFLYRDIQGLLATAGGSATEWQLRLNYHQGGFAKTNPALLTRIANFEADYAIQLEPVYTGKLLMALEDLLAKKFFQAGQHLILLHSGGLQGYRSSGSNQPIM